MHKGAILLFKSSYEEDVRERVDEFMGHYQGSVWDWYSIGGRWSGTLSKYDPGTDPENFETCQSCGGVGCSRCENGRRLKWPTEWKGHPGDIFPLKDCIDVVKEWAEAIDDPDELVQKSEEYKLDSYDSMRAYYLHRASDILYQTFSFEANVFNTESYDFSIPDDVDGWVAVIVDMHN